ncbi:tetratricopeptide repeat protein [Thioalkalivibrio sp. ALE11]|uniref:tetratricopeptide repeat protein n=1 Tax=Thioalkalivibrio sp. ALE11 TaxID=1265494 RepID=UPI000375A803|nr:tetratricopeptide repeat protein [Thioalkalivibrio sp. ALE11]
MMMKLRQGELSVHRTPRALRLLGGCAVFAILAGCATPEPRPAPEEPATDVPEPEVLEVEPGAAEDPELAAGVDSAASVLAQRAEQARADADLARAGQLLERALRIAPRDARLWQRLAAVRLEQRDFDQAERLAQRSLGMAAGDRALQRENWTVILQAREGRGDTQGAREAREALRALGGERV